MIRSGRAALCSGVRRWRGFYGFTVSVRLMLLRDDKRMGFWVEMGWLCGSSEASGGVVVWLSLQR